MTRPIDIADFRAAVRAGGGSHGALVRYVAETAPAATAAPRTFSFVFSDGSIDRYNDTLAPAGWKLDAFKANPIVLFGHDASRIENVVGNARNVRVEGGRLLGDIEFAPEGVSPTADQACRLVAAGVIRTVSVGFQPITWKMSSDPTRKGGIDFTAMELLEVSLVPIPANAGATLQARAKTFAYPRTSSPAAARQAGLPVTIEQRRERAHAVAAAVGRAGSFESFGHLLQAVAHSRGGHVDPRLIRAPTGAGEVDPSAGGFLVGTEFAADLIDSVYGSASVLAPLCDQRTTALPTTKVPGLDETSRADGSRYGGVTSYWKDEGTGAPTSLPRFRAMEFGSKKLISYCAVTNELLDDAPMLGAHITAAFQAEAAFQLDRTILTGSGAGVPLGILNSPALITVAKQTGQGSQTLLAENINAMWSRLPAPSRRRAVWLCDEDVEGLIDAMQFTIGTAGATAPAASGLYAQGAPRIKGRPLITIEQASPLGQVGDIVLADLSDYLLVQRSATTALSLDYGFNSDQAFFRFTLRVDGQPSHKAPITPFNGSGVTRSPFVALAAR